MNTANKISICSLIMLFSSVLLLSCGGSSEKNATTKSTVVGGKALEETIKKITVDIPKEEDLVIKEDTVWTKEQSPIVLTKTVLVTSDARLEIKPGVEVKVDPRKMIMIKGNFIAEGTEDEPISFTSNQEGEKWDGIQFLKGSLDYDSEEVIRGTGCSVSYVKIENSDTAITCIESSPHITNSLFRNNNAAISSRDESNPLIKNNNFIDNVTAIYCYNSSSPRIIQNTIVGDEGRGIRVETYSNPEISSNLIFGKGESWWVGIYVKNYSSPKIHGNALYSNGRYELELAQKSPAEKSLEVDASGNWWGVTDKVTIGKRIKDKNDFANLGLVIFEPFKTEKMAKVGYVGKLQ